MVSMILVSTVLLVSLTASANLLRNGAVSRSAIEAERLGIQILDEISSRDFLDRDLPVFGLETGEVAANRTTYDDVDDYNGYVSDPPTHRDGTDIDGFSDWTFSVTVTPAEPVANGIVTSNDDQQPLRVITVTCTDPAGTTTSISTLVSDVPNDASESDSFEKWRRLTLDFSDRELTITAPLRNSPDVTY